MADDVDPRQSLTTEADLHPHPAADTELSSGHVHEPVEVAMVEIELLEYEAIEVDAPVPIAEEDDAKATDPLPTMTDLDRVAAELDDVDARLASLDEQRP